MASRQQIRFHYGLPAEAMHILLAVVLLAVSGCAHMATDRQLERGQYAEAEKSLDRLSSEGSSIKSEELVRVCYTYSKLKRYDKLFASLAQLEKNIAEGDHTISSLLVATTSIFPTDIRVVPHLMKAEAYLEIGDYPRAIASAEECRRQTEFLNTFDKMYNWDRRFQIRSLGVLVMANAFSGNRPEAMAHLADLENQGIGFGAGYMVNKEKKYTLGKTYMSMGLYEKMLESFSLGDFASIFVDVFTLGILQTDLKYSAFGFIELPIEFARNKALFETGRVAEAKSGYDALLKNPATATNGEIYWAILYDRGRIAEREGKLQEAVDLYRRAIEVIEQQRSTIHTEASKIGFVGNKQEVYGRIIFTLASGGEAEKAFEYAERAKSRALVDQLASITEFGAPGRDSNTRMLISDLAQSEMDLKSPGFAVNPDESGKRGIQIQKKLQAAAPEVASLVTVSGIAAAEIAQYLKADETLLEYYYSDDRLIAFLVSGGKVRSVVLSSKNLFDLSFRFRNNIMRPDSGDFAALSETLYRMLISPVEKYLTTPTVVIVPHGILHYLPFNALTDGRRYLIDRYNVVFLPSASVYRYLKKTSTTADGGILIFGNPDLGDPRYQLAHAEQEAVAIAKLFDKNSLYIKDRATEGVVKKAGKEFPFIHFATHGMFQSESPLDSALYLSKDDENDGMLTVKELYSLDLKANLVTLSACETGLGSIKAGDDLIGLQRGFLYAGAGAVIASLWKVDDAATSTLMVDFYRNLKTTKKSDALRQAQLAAKTKYGHPYYWAAFQYTGPAD